MENLIHRVVLTDEARFDYEFCLDDVNHTIDWTTDNDFRDLDPYDIPTIYCPKLELQKEYSYWIQNNSELQSRYFFSTKHWDDEYDAWLVFFIRRGERLGTMQYWHIVGINRLEEWDEEEEETGQYRKWLNTKVSNLPKGEKDIVRQFRQWKKIQRWLDKADEKERRFYERLFD